ncbi:unnamed protein product [Symbiodinium sp. CCMP2592]|nr:unnamed protein product [Symbiodinium sp. CCMP2592]
MQALEGDYRWLSELGVFDMEARAEWLADKITEEADAERQRGFAKWRSSVRNSHPKQVSWIKRRAALKSGAAQPAPADGAVLQYKAIHPASLIAEAETEWVQRWTRGDVAIDPLRELLEELPPPRQVDVRPVFYAESLQRAASRMRGKAGGPDSWEVSHFEALPDPFWAALGALWQKCYEAGKVPARWKEARVTLIAKPDGGHRSTRDVFIRMIDAMEDPDMTIVGQDAAFRRRQSARRPHSLTTDRFGAPRFRVFELRCDARKCQVASRAQVGRQAAETFRYGFASSFTTLGVTFDFAAASAPTLVSRYSFEQADHRLQCISMIVKNLDVKAHLIRTLVIPMLIWCGAVASLEHEKVKQLRRAILVTSHANVAVDAPPITLFEVMGWGCDPQFARHWSALVALISYVGRPPIWLDEAPMALAVKPWFQLLPLAAEVLRELGWWTDARGSRIFRRDARSELRTFVIAYDSVSILYDWLRDWRRRTTLANTGRVVRALHRSDPVLGRGRALPGVPTGSLVVLAGHRKLQASASTQAQRSAALVTGRPYFRLQ